MVSLSEGHQDIDSYNAMMHPELLIPISYRHHHAAINNVKTGNKNEGRTIQDAATQGHVTDGEEVAIRNYLDHLVGNSTDAEEANEKMS